jgi:hypothetical protein
MAAGIQTATDRRIDDFNIAMHHTSNIQEQHTSGDSMTGVDIFPSSVRITLEMISCW